VSTPHRAPDWRARLAARAHRLAFAPITPGAKRATATLFALVLALSGANLEFTAHEVNAVRAAEMASARSAASVVQLCRAGNEFRAQQVGLWDHIVTISQPPPHETRAAERKRLATIRAFVAYVHRVFAPRDCARRFS
jgi:hypothetical protein